MDPQGPQNADAPQTDNQHVNDVIQPNTDQSQIGIPAAANEPVTAVESPQPPVITEPQSTIPPAGPKKGSKAKLLGLVILLLILIAGGIYWFALRKTANGPTQSNAKTQNKDIESLKVAMIEGPTGLYPKSTVANSDTQVNNQIYEGLVGYQNRNKIVPLLARSWTNPDASTWVFTLQPNVKFHTGKMLTANDVKASIEYIQKNNKKVGDTFAGTIKSITTDGNNKVTIVTDGPDPILLNKLAFLYIFDTSAAGQEDKTAGTGPYQLKPGTRVDIKNIELTAFDGYHGGHVNVRNLTFAQVDTEQAALEGLQKGTFNIVGDFINGDIGKGKNFHEFDADDLGIYFLNINSTKKNSPLAKLAVRQALNEALDVSKVITAAGISGKPATQMMSQDIPGYNPDVKHAAYNLDHAKELLNSAGYPKGLTLTLDYVANVQPLADEITKQYAAAGITIKQQKRDDFDGILNNLSKSDLIYLTYSSDVLDSMDIFQSSFTANGLGTYQDNELDGLLAKAGAAATSAERLKLLQQASARLSDQAASVPLYSRTRIWLADKDYGLVQDHPSAELGVFFWKVSQP